MSDNIEILLTVWKEEDFFVARASTPTGDSSFQKFNEPRIITDVCQSRDRNRAISYALTELAAKVSAGR
jgi:hypothetical protein